MKAVSVGGGTALLPQILGESLKFGKLVFGYKLCMLRLQETTGQWLHAA